MTWKERLDSKCFFLGLIFGLSCFVGLGIIASRNTYFDPFYHFHNFLSPQSFFFPTINQIRNTIERKSKENQIIVILGGDSIFNGMPQADSEVWSVKLQELLGDKFFVINLAFQGGHLRGPGSYAFEMLMKKKRKVLFVTNSFPLNLGDIEGRFQYSFWDAYYKKLLFDVPSRNTKLKLKHKDIQDQTYHETKRQGFMDSFLYFNDLWNSVGYYFLFTTWNQNNDWFFKPRHGLHDPDLLYIPTKITERFSKVPDKGVMEYLHAAYKPCDQETINTTEFESLLDEFPVEIRQNIIIEHVRKNPYYVKKLPLKFQQCIDNITQLSITLYEKNGYHAGDIGRKLVTEDFDDLNHVIVSGGYKLAHDVAVHIHQLAQEKGYLLE